MAPARVVRGLSPRRAASEHDEYWQKGALLLGRRDTIEGPAIRQNLLGWTIPGCFLPLITVCLCNEIRVRYQAVRPSDLLSSRTICRTKM